MKRCLDSWAVLAWLDGEEPAAKAVERAIKRERPAMSWMNLVEVHYRTIRDHGRQEADQVLAELRPLITENLPGIASMRSVSALKAELPIALADCFAVALAAEEEAALLTGDPEIIDRAAQLPCQVVDLRADS
ncbi:MAG: type II toxin-antitoxin system VapC family toxin [Actinobacteria bacterium]|nr:MAG: type II toxin-antitoxin system VapC family toxin [Actinomycetota bacterium]